MITSMNETLDYSPDDEMGQNYGTSEGGPEATPSVPPKEPAPPVNEYKERLLALLDRFGIEPDQNYLDQHLLVSEETIDKLVASAEVTENDSVLEIGPGPGQITEALAQKAGEVCAIEIDDRFEPILEELTRRHPNVEIIMGSALEEKWPKANKLVANPPFSIFEALLGKIIQDKNIQEVFIVIGERFYKVSVPSELQMSKTGLMSRAFFDTELVGVVDPDSFYPRSRERSVILKMKRKRKKDGNPGLRSLVSRMLRSPNSNVGNLVNDAIFDSAERFAQDPRQMPTPESLHISKNIMRKRLQDLSNSDITTIWHAIDSISNRKHRNRGRSRQNEEDSDEYSDDEYEL